MRPQTLPDQFAWRPHADSQALTLRGRIIAIACALPNGKARSTRRIGTRRMVHEFHPDLASATRYLSAWAWRWESQILEIYSCIPRSPNPSAPLAPQGSADHAAARV